MAENLRDHKLIETDVLSRKTPGEDDHHNERGAGQPGARPRHDRRDRARRRRQHGDGRPDPQQPGRGQGADAEPGARRRGPARLPAGASRRRAGAGRRRRHHRLRPPGRHQHLPQAPVGASRRDRRGPAGRGARSASITSRASIPRRWRAPSSTSGTARARSACCRSTTRWSARRSARSSPAACRC